MTTSREPVPSPPEVDVKDLEKNLIEQAKQNVKDREENTTVDGQKKYDGGPIPRA